MSQTILTIDTAMNGCSVAVYNTDGLHPVAHSQMMVRGHSEALMPMVDTLLKKEGFVYADLNKIAVTVGPGAFTGLRIGLSAAQALGLALKIPVVGFTTLDVIAREFAEGHQKPFAVLIETKRDDYYAGFYDENGKVTAEPCALSEEVLAARLTPEMVLVGDAVGRFAKTHDGFTCHEILLPDPALMCLMAAQGLGATPPKPLYLRGADVSTPKTPPRQLAEKAVS